MTTTALRQPVQPQLVRHVRPGATPAPVIGGAQLPAVLSVIAGMTDVTGWLLLGGLFTAHITGNLVVIAADLVRGGSPHLAQVLAVPVFILFVALAAQLARRLARGSDHAADGGQATLRTLLAGQVVLLLGALAIAAAVHASSQPEGVASDVVAMLAVGAMGVQNALLHLTRKSVPTTAVMTGNLVVCTIALLRIVWGDGDQVEAHRQWDATWPLIAGFLVGCVVGAIAVRGTGDWAWAVPTATAAVTLVWQVRSPRTA